MVVEQLKNMTIDTKANLYFDGKVTSRSFYYEDGRRITLGIILPGTYFFSVGDREDIQIVAGAAEILLPEKTEWEKVAPDSCFTVPKDTGFDIRCCEVTEYLCEYVKE